MKEKLVNVNLGQPTMADDDSVISASVANMLNAAIKEMFSNPITSDDQHITTHVPVEASQSSERSDNRISSPSPSSSYESTIEHTLYSPLSVASSSSKESITVVVFSEDNIGKQVHPNRKRKQKVELETGICAPPKAKKTKAYENDHPFEDKKEERKRLNAIRAKEHREHEKQDKEALKKELADVKKENDGLKKVIETLQENKVRPDPREIENTENERDVLKRELETMREKMVKRTQELEVFKNFSKQAVSVITLLQSGEVSH